MNIDGTRWGPCKIDFFSHEFGDWRIQLSWRIKALVLRFCSVCSQVFKLIAVFFKKVLRVHHYARLVAQCLNISEVYPSRSNYISVILVVEDTASSSICNGRGTLSMQCTKFGVSGVTSYSSWTTEEARLPLRDAEDHQDRRGVSENRHILWQTCAHEHIRTSLFVTFFFENSEISVN